MQSLGHPVRGVVRPAVERPALVHRPQLLSPVEEEELEPVDPKQFRRLLETQRTDPDPAQTAEASVSAEPPTKLRTSLPAVPSHAAKATAKEEVLFKLNQGFHGLSSVLSGIDEKLQHHNRTSGELSESVKQLPELMRELPNASRTGVELLTSISRTIEEQGSVTRDLVARVGQLAQMMQQIPVALQRVDQRLDQHERTASDLGSTLQTVQLSVREMQAENARVQKEVLEEFRRAQEADRERHEQARKSDQEAVKQLAERTSFQSQVMIVLLFLLVVAFGALVWSLNRGLT